MPYIHASEKEKLAGVIKGFKDVLTNDWNTTSNPGHLNYLITELCLVYLNNREERFLRDAKYHDYNDIVGVLESAKLEFYRRAVTAYEEQKIAENGDVYPK